jgi:hypothetical protein
VLKGWQSPQVISCPAQEPKLGVRLGPQGVSLQPVWQHRPGVNEYVTPPIKSRREEDVALSQAPCAFSRGILIVDAGFNCLPGEPSPLGPGAGEQKYLLLQNL